MMKRYTAGVAMHRQGHYALMLALPFICFAAAHCGTGLSTGDLRLGQVGNAAPAILTTPPESARETEPYECLVLAEDPDGDTLLFTLALAPAGMSVSATGLVSWTPAQGQAGSHDVALSVSDGVASVEIDWTIAVSGAAGAPPQITSNAPLAATEGVPFGYRITATGAPLPLMTVTGVPPWMTFDGIDMLSGLPAASDIGSSGTITVTASNGVPPDASQQFSVMVASAQTSTPPVITSTPPINAVALAPYIYQISATGTPLPTISVNNAPPWLTFDAAARLLSGTPPMPATGHAITGLITVSASNGIALDASQEFSIEVTTGWYFESVDGMTDTSYASLAVDTNSHMHIAYYDALGTHLRYATDVSGVWQSEVADSADHAGEQASIQVDASGQVHIAYSDRPHSAIKYATKSPGGTWAVRSVAGIVDAWDQSSLQKQRFLSLALDSVGNAHIAYHSFAAGDLRYTTNGTGVWSAPVVVDNSAQDIGKHPSLALDGNDRVHIGYADLNNWAIKYASNASGLWTTEVAESLGSGGQVTLPWISLALDSTGAPHMAYKNWNNSHLIYTRKTPTRWEAETVDSSVAALSLVLDGDDKAHIGYGDYMSITLKYATNTSGMWAMVHVEGVGSTGDLFPSIGLSLAGKPCIAFSDMAGDLRFARGQ